MPAIVPPGKAARNIPATDVYRSRPPGVQWGMTYRAVPLAVVVASLAAAGLAGCSSSSSPSFPHAWCGPLITQFHAKETRGAYLHGLAAAEKKGAPVAGLIADESAFAQDEATANTATTGSFAALAAAPAAIAKVIADLKQLNAECGQPAGAYKGDNT